jgi:hypothetical protein
MIGYRGAHVRVVVARGPAREYTCIACWTAPAQTWALRRTALDTLTERHNGRVVPYSLDLDDYVPMCRPCHSTYDAKHLDQPTPERLVLVDVADLADLDLVGLGSTLGRRGR